MTFPDPWRSLESPSEAAPFEREARREIARHHPLHGKVLRALARRYDNDDVLFAVASGADVAVVHLTYSGRKEPRGWPGFELFPSLDAFLQSVRVGNGGDPPTR